MLLIIQKCLGLLLGDLVLNGQIVIVPSSLILPCLQIADKLGFLRCQWTAALAQIVDLPAEQNSNDCVFSVFLRQGAYTDISLLSRVAERDILAAGDGISSLLHERKEDVEVMRLFNKSLINIKAESVTIGELFDIALPAIVAHAMWLQIFNHRHSVLDADQVTEPSHSQRAAPEISKLASTVQHGGIPIDVIMDVVFVCVSADDECMIAF